jgi:ATPase family associated with various cellular activities (AAA)
MSAGPLWIDGNQRALTAALAEIRAALGDEVPPVPPPPSDPSRPYAVDAIGAAFQLSPFERAVLLLCAGMELDASFAALCARIHDDPSRAYPTFALALAKLPDAHWSAITPGGALRRWRLVEPAAGHPITTAPLRIEERILHFVAGVDQLDERLAGTIETVAPVPLAPSHDDIAARIATAWVAVSRGEEELAPIQLAASDPLTRRGVFAAACARLGLTAHATTALALPVSTADAETFVRLYERESWLTGCALMIDCEGVESSDAIRAEAVRQIVDRLRVPVIAGTHEPSRIGTRTSMTLEVPRPRASEHRALWAEALGDAAAQLNGALDRAAAQFTLAPAAIRAIAGTVRHADDPAQELWRACRVAARRRMDDLAQRIEGAAGWDDLVLPDVQKQMLFDLVNAVRYRGRVYEEWGFAARDSRGQGVTALFAGVSGSGKTMAAEVVARELELDLYRIDLSGVVSKYIGETEKNLRRVFEAAEDSGAILLFDEADALFGRRSEVKDSHDRYANIEVSYLLQRMEAYRGVAILTTNLREAVDPAFLRRLRFVVQFPFPGAAERLEIWRRIFPPGVPQHGVEIEKLARLAIAGGNIRNIAVQAAFGAARDGSPLTMHHLLDAARAEYAKLEKNLSGSETEGWT